MWKRLFNKLFCGVAVGICYFTLMQSKAWYTGFLWVGLILLIGVISSLFLGNNG